MNEETYETNRFGSEPLNNDLVWTDVNARKTGEYLTVSPAVVLLVVDVGKIKWSLIRGTPHADERPVLAEFLDTCAKRVSDEDAAVVIDGKTTRCQELAGTPTHLAEGMDGHPIRRKNLDATVAHFGDDEVSVRGDRHAANVVEPPNPCAAPTYKVGGPIRRSDKEVIPRLQ